MSEEEKDKEKEAPTVKVAPRVVTRAVSQPPPVEPINVTDPVPDEVEVVPIRSEYSVRIGPDWYSFNKGKPLKVPRVIVPHLERVGIIAPSIH